MIADFSIDKHFFTSKYLSDVSNSLLHDFITEKWLEVGALVAPKGSVYELMDLVKTLPPKFHQRWLYAIEYGKRREVESEWWNFESYETFDKLCSLNSFFKTAIAEEAVALVLSGEDDTKRICATTGFEVLGASVCSESTNFRMAADLSRADIAPTESARDVWSARLKALAINSKNILIIDRYFFESAHRKINRPLAEDSMRNFFIFLSQLDMKHNVKIISYGDVKGSQFHSEIHGRFHDVVCRTPALKKALSSLTLISAEEDFFKGDSHDRFIGFDRHVCQIGNGMRVLGGSPLPRSTFTAKFDRYNELRGRETACRSQTLWKEEMMV